MAVSWDKPQHTNLTLWDIDREFQDAHEAYEQWQARHRRTRSKWACFGTKNRDDAVGKALSLGRQVQRIMEQGKERFGARFEEGDTKCNTILSAQLLRIQYEIRQPLYESVFSSTPIIPIDDIIMIAKSTRRALLRCASNTHVSNHRSYHLFCLPRVSKWSSVLSQTNFGKISSNPNRAHCAQRGLSPTTSTMTGRSARNAMHASPSLLTLDSLRTDVSSSHHILPWTQWRPTTKRISRVIAATKPSTIHTPSSTTFSRSRSAVRGVACDCPYKEAQAGS